MKNYNDLNSKERFFRTLWFLPISLALLAGLLWIVDDTSNLMRFLIGSSFKKLMILAVIGVLGVAQLIGNYLAWKR